MVLIINRCVMMKYKVKANCIAKLGNIDKTNNCRKIIIRKKTLFLNLFSIFILFINFTIYNLLLFYFMFLITFLILTNIFNVN